MIGLRELLQILVRRWWWVLAGCLLGAAAGVAVALVSKPVYRADVVLQPIQRTDGGGALQAVAGQVGGLASLAGLNLGDSKDAAVAIATLKSRQLTNAFIQEKGLLPVLYPDLWDAEHEHWKVARPQDAPTVWAAEQLFARKIRKITENRSSGLITMSIEWTDPEVAAEWAEALVRRANNFLRSEVRASAEQNIKFLDVQLRATSIAEVRQALNRLLEEQWKRLMLAQGDSEFAFRTIDPAVVPKGKINIPKRNVVLIWMIMGLLLSSAAAIAQSLVWRSGSHASRADA